MCKLKFRVARVHLNLEKEEPVYENDISAENKTEKEGTWIPQENENKEWQKCFKEKKGKGRKVLSAYETADVVFCYENHVKMSSYAKKRSITKKKRFFFHL